MFDCLKPVSKLDGVDPFAVLLGCCWIVIGLQVFGTETSMDSYCHTLKLKLGCRLLGLASTFSSMY